MGLGDPYVANNAESPGRSDVNNSTNQLLGLTEEEYIPQ